MNAKKQTHLPNCNPPSIS